MSGPFPRPWRTRVAAIAALSTCTAVAGAAPLTLDAALEAAQRESPALAVVAGRIDAARHAAVSAAELPDPKLSFGLENFPIGGAERFRLTGEPMTMQRISWMQELPNRDKRDARAAVAAARVLRGEADRRVAAALVRRETALAWIRRHAVEQQLVQLDALDNENRLLDTAVRAQLAGGKGMAADAVMPRQEAAMLADRRDELAAQRSAATAALRRWVGDAASEPLQGAVPAWPLADDALHARMHLHPELVAFDAMAAMLDAELREAQSTKKSDWGVELAYQRRGRAFGDMVSLMFSVELPLFAERRQDPQIAAKAAERRTLDAEREAMRREHQQMLGADLAELGRLDRALQRLRAQLLPLADERVELMLAAYRAGRSSLTELVAARRERAELQLRSAALQGERDAMAARLHFTYDEPPTGARP